MKRMLKKGETRVWGDLSGVTGNLDECEITDEERVAGIDISNLLEGTK